MAQIPARTRTHFVYSYAMYFFSFIGTILHKHQHLHQTFKILTDHWQSWATIYNVLGDTVHGERGAVCRPKVKQNQADDSVQLICIHVLY